MKVTIAWWDLANSSQTIETLQTYLAEEGVAPWEHVENMLLKLWISDAAGNRWGAVMLWGPDTDETAPLPPNRATELIGYPPTVRLAADVDALVGSLLPVDMRGRGLAFERKGRSHG